MEHINKFSQPGFKLWYTVDALFQRIRINFLALPFNTELLQKLQTANFGDQPKFSISGSGVNSISYETCSC